MELVIIQGIVMLLFFVGALVSTLTPVLISHRHRNKYKSLSNGRCQTVINACNSIGGGVLLATCFVALIPLVEHSYSEALSSAGMLLAHYPYAEMTILCGLFLVILIEQLVILIQSKQSGSTKSSTEDELETLFSDDEKPASSNEHNASGHSHSHAHHAVVSKSLLHSIILVITLGLHTLFEGMAIGLVNDINLLVTLVLAVMLHELCCAIALGVNLGQQKISRKTAIIVCIVFSVMMPSGIGLGLALGRIQGFTGLVLTAVLQGIATGTFVYVLFMEIIPSSISSGNSIVQMLLMFIGCVLMTTLIVLTHSHEGTLEVITSNCTTNASIIALLEP